MLVRKVGIWSLAKTFAIVYAGLGVVFGTLGLLLMAVLLVFASGGSGIPSSLELIFLGALMIVFIPIVAALKGLLVGAISALLFNFAAGLKGGFELDVEAGA